MGIVDAMRRFVLAAGFAVVAMLTTGSIRLHACSCGAPPRNSSASCSSSWRVDAVFVGEVLAVQQLTEPSFMGSRRAILAVRESFKGDEAGVIDVLTGSSDADCGFDFKAGSTYLVFASRHPATNKLGTSLCSRTALVGWAGNDLKLLRKPARQLREPALLHGRVIRSEFQTSRTPRMQEPLVGAPIRLIGQAGLRETRSGSDGRFEFRVPPGRYRLTVEVGEQFYSQPDATSGIDVRVTEATPCAPIEIDVRSNGRVRGRLIDQAGRAVPFLNIDLAKGYRSEPNARVITDADGRFRFERLAPGDYELGLTFRRYGRDKDFAIPLRPGAARFEVGLEADIDAGTIALPEGVVIRPVSGVVVDETGTPISNAEVRVETTGRTLGVSSEPVRTDAQGRFLISVVAGRVHELVAEAWSSADDRLTYRTGRSAAFDSASAPPALTLALSVSQRAKLR